jgi:alpha-beta hydrolase superfamily lysophospholipase
MFWLGLAIVWSVPVILLVGVIAIHIYLCVNYIQYVERIFQEIPLFIIPRGQADPAAEDVMFESSDGLKLRGCYYKASGPRRGVILFGLEFGSDRWSCRSYCEHLIAAGFDVFAFEPRNQGSSDHMAGYEPLQWVTDFEVRDAKAAVAYLKRRSDADKRGIGFFGISKGGGAGLFVAARDPYIRCCVTDGVFGTYTTLVPYMRHFFRIYNRSGIQGLIPSWYYGYVGLKALRRIARLRRCHFPHLEKYVALLAPRPWLMIHGDADTYIKPEMAERLFARASEPKELWMVPLAKHNEALQIVGDEYRRRVLDFFQSYLSEGRGSTDKQQGPNGEKAELHKEEHLQVPSSLN